MTLDMMAQTALSVVINGPSMRIFKAQFQTYAVFNYVINRITTKTMFCYRETIIVA